MPTYRPSQSSSERLWTRIQQSDAQVNQLTVKILILKLMVENVSHSPTFASAFDHSFSLCYTFFLLLMPWIFLAEKFLESVEGNQNYPLLLLTLLEKSQENVIRVCAAVTFKNFIKRNWRIVSFTMKLVHMVFMPLEALVTYCCTSLVKQCFAALSLNSDCIIIYGLSSEGWRWAQQSIWVRPNSDQRKHCQFDAEQPRADPETGESSPVAVTRSDCEDLQKPFQPVCLCAFHQLSDAISIIGREDFPQKWPNLLTEMVNRFQSGDFHIINGVLRTAHSLFKR